MCEMARAGLYLVFDSLFWGLLMQRSFVFAEGPAFYDHRQQHPHPLRRGENNTTNSKAQPVLLVQFVVIDIATFVYY
jgi:hypothetical protein